MNFFQRGDGAQRGKLRLHDTKKKEAPARADGPPVVLGSGSTRFASVSLSRDCHAAETAMPSRGSQKKRVADVRSKQAMAHGRGSPTQPTPKGRKPIMSRGPAVETEDPFPLPQWFLVNPFKQVNAAAGGAEC
eukprot:2826857-Prymnesium_polylepis.1